MKQNTLLKLALTLALLLGAIMGQNWWSKYQASRPVAYQQVVSQLSPDEIDKIVLQQGDKNLVLVKKDKQWLVDNQPANATAAADLINGLINPRRVELIAQTSKVHKQLELEKSKALVVGLSTKGKKILEVLLGKDSSGATFLRLADRDFVYRLKPALFPQPPEKEKWLDKGKAGI